MASARISALAVVVAAACVGEPPTRYVQHAPTLAKLKLRAPAGVLASYDVAFDRWLVATPTASAIVDAPPPAGIAGPDALAHLLGMRVVSRESLSDGFAATVEQHAAAQQRVTIVVRELGSLWLRCVGDVELCKSLKRG